MGTYFRKVADTLDSLTFARTVWLFLPIYTFSRLIYRFALDIRFSDDLFYRGWQLLDPVLLKSELLRSLYYLHSQPPLYNLSVGIVLKLFGDRTSLAFHFIHLVLGFTLYLALYVLQVKLNVSRLTAFILSTLFIVSPACILYENWFFYTYPLAVLLLISSLLFMTYLETSKSRYLALTFVALTLLAGSRSVFHLFWLLIVSVILVRVSKDRGKAMLAAGISLLLVFSIYFKNEIVFGKFTASTWLGMNFWRLTTDQLPGETIRTLVGEGAISPLALVPRFSKPEDYPASYFDVRGFEGIRALRELRKSTGAVNFNHIGWIAISDQYLKDDIYVLKHYPRRYVAGLVGSFYRYSVPASDHFGVRKNASKIPRLVSLEGMLLGGTSPIGTTEGSRSLYLVLLVGLPFLLIAGCLLALQWVKGTVMDKKMRLAVAYICFNLLTLTMAINMIERGENNRMRFMLDPLFVVLLGVAIAHVTRNRRRASGNQSSPAQALTGRRDPR